LRIEILEPSASKAWVEKLIDTNQSAFIEGRNILEGVVTLHEILHEFRRTGRVSYLRLILKKHMTRSNGSLSRR
jgi:hypothetical protein